MLQRCDNIGNNEGDHTCTSLHQRNPPRLCEVAIFRLCFCFHIPLFPFPRCFFLFLFSRPFFSLFFFHVLDLKSTLVYTDAQIRVPFLCCCFQL
jgi:hypothetical protein